MDRRQLKQQARQNLGASLLTGFLYALIVFAVLFLSFKLTAEGTAKVLEKYIDPNSMMSIEEFYEVLNSETLLRDLMKHQPSGTAQLLSTLLNFMLVVVSAGLSLFCLNKLRSREETSCWNLFDSFSMFVRVLLLFLLKALFMSLWALLFFFPAIIAYYSYSQALYILLDNPEKGVLQCILESKQMMRGHKWERFVLDLSFIGWFLLMSVVTSVMMTYAAMLFPQFGVAAGVFGLCVGGVAVGFAFFPYYNLTAAGYYRSLTGDDIPVEDGWEPEL